MEKKPLVDRIKEWAVVVALITSGLSIKVSYTNNQLEFEIEKTQKALAAAQEQANGFALAGMCND